jgi:Raf kinase inhibitor-like YbhB/YbcL family protein
MDERKTLFPVILILICVAIVAGGCEPNPSLTSTPAPQAPAAQEQAAQVTPFEVSSTAFATGEAIPARYTCDGDDISPPLEWKDPPQNAESFALIADDPDAPAGTWVHWVLYNLPADTRNLPPGVPADADLTGRGLHGKNSWKQLGYGGPCPPGGTHRYFFELYALDTVLDLEAGADKKALLQVMEGHILAQTVLMGTYTRQ